MNQPPDAVPPATAVPETSADGPSEKPSLQIVDLQSRFLFPFFFDRLPAKEASEALKRSTPVEQHVWACAFPRGAYTQEVLGHAADFLFQQGDGAGCSCLRATNAATQPWFQGVRVLMGGGAGLPVNLVHGLGVELFLTDCGTVSYIVPSRLVGKVLGERSSQDEWPSGRYHLPYPEPRWRGYHGDVQCLGAELH